MTQEVKRCRPEASKIGNVTQLLDNNYLAFLTENPLGFTKEGGPLLCFAKFMGRIQSENYVLRT